MWVILYSRPRPEDFNLRVVKTQAQSTVETASFLFINAQTLWNTVLDGHTKSKVKSAIASKVEKEA